MLIGASLYFCKTLLKTPYDIVKKKRNPSWICQWTRCLEACNVQKTPKGNYRSILEENIQNCFATSGKVPFPLQKWTSMHSSRMRTARRLTVSGVCFLRGGSALWGGGGSACPRHGGKADPTLVDRMTDASENITLPHAGGKREWCYWSFMTM